LAGAVPRDGGSDALETFVRGVRCGYIRRRAVSVPEPRAGAAMTQARVLRHVCTSRLITRRCFPSQVLDSIEVAIRAFESRHAGEIRFVVETRLDLAQLLAGVSPRRRALDLFGLLRVWDTQHNNGVLIYVLLADRTVEIVADRGLAVRIPQPQWDEVCRRMESEFHGHRFAAGSLAGIAMIGELLERHFPASGPAARELPDEPLLL
jgi:TPM domain